MLLLPLPPPLLLLLPPLPLQRQAHGVECLTGEDGEKNGWGRVENSMILGEEGWCNAEKPVHRCPCHLDGLGGAFCELVSQPSSQQTPLQRLAGSAGFVSQRDFNMRYCLLKLAPVTHASRHHYAPLLDVCLGIVWKPFLESGASMAAPGRQCAAAGCVAQVHEAVCVNQCSGHGECSIGFCKCHAGWYGHDCSQRVAGHPDEPGAAFTRVTVNPCVHGVPSAGPSWACRLKGPAAWLRTPTVAGRACLGDTALQLCDQYHSNFTHILCCLSTPSSCHLLVWRWMTPVHLQVCTRLSGHG